MGGEAKARGTREERVAKAVALKNKQEEEKIKMEINYCYHQRYFLDNIDSFKFDISRHRVTLENFIFNSVDKTTKSKTKLGEVVKVRLPEELLEDYYGLIFSITVKKQTRIHYKAIFETAYGICSFTFAPNGTAGWYISENIECEILEKCFKILTQMNYIGDKLEEEMDDIVS